MPAWLLPALGVGAQVFSAMQAAKGQQEANAAQMEFNAQEAQKQRDWQQMMSNSAHQREVEDLRAAGLNPLLSVNHGATVPSGASAHAELRSERSEMAQILSNTAKEAAELSLNHAMRKKVLAETSTAQATARMAKQQADIATSRPGRLLAQWRYFLDQSGLGRGVQNLMGLFTAKKVADKFRGRISFRERR